MSVKKITDRITIRANAEVLTTKNDAKLTGIGGFERKPVVGVSGVVGSVEDVEASITSCEVTLIDRNDKLLGDIASLEGATITASVKGGKSYMMRDAFCKANLAVSAGEGEVPVIFYGQPWEEMLA
ncbi:MAG: phage tail tube protein [Planctomycetota bacterium]